MNKLRFGHRVKAFITYGWEGGKYIANETNGKHWVLIDGHNVPDLVNEVKLDPEADEFLIGDEVQFSNDSKRWVGGVYNGYDDYGEFHVSELGITYIHCRYPQEKETIIVNIDNMLGVSDYNLDVVYKGNVVYRVKR